MRRGGTPEDAARTGPERLNHAFALCFLDQQNAARPDSEVTKTAQQFQPFIRPVGKMEIEDGNIRLEINNALESVSEFSRTLEEGERSNSSQGPRQQL